MFGPHLASASLTLLTAPAVYLTSVINSPMAFLLAQFFTGFSLSTFVSTQYWMSTMFSGPAVGLANGVAVGWGNIGGEATQLLMPFMSKLIQHMGATKFTAWRIAFFIPGVLQTLSTFAVMFFGQDLPDGNFTKLHRSGHKHRDSGWKVIYHGVTNCRGWVTALLYGYCFGVELTIDNIIAQYYQDKFNLSLSLHRMLCSCQFWPHEPIHEACWRLLVGLCCQVLWHEGQVVGLVDLPNPWRILLHCARKS